MTRLVKSPKRFAEQIGYIRSVSLFVDQFKPGEPGHGSPDSFWWTNSSRFNLSLLAGSRPDWKDFAKHETVAWRADYGQNTGADFENWWLPNPSRNPVIIVEGTDQQFYVWDGNHRVGIAILNGRRTLPALVGCRK
jgi:hypothetical protein